MNLGKKGLASALTGDGVWDAGCSDVVDAFSMARSINGLLSCTRLGSLRFAVGFLTVTSSRGISIRRGTYCASSSLLGFTVGATVFH